jgi:hypothetical protein
MSRVKKIKDQSRRVLEVLKWQTTKPFRLKLNSDNGNKFDGRITFLIAHFNSPEFLAATLDGIRKFHPGSSILVADATSDWSSYVAAKKECDRFRAELRPLAIQHRHSGILNVLFRQAKTEFAVFLDQDCILLHRLDSLLRRVEDDILLAGARDKMLVDYELRSGKKPNFKPQFLRSYENYVHASLMVLKPEKIRARFGSAPFRWKKEFGSHAHEKYHGLCHQLHESHPNKMLLIDSLHSAYGLGMVYIHDNIPLAYHNWYSGRVFKQEGTLDGLSIEWLKESMEHFLRDYWAGKLKLGLPELPK